MMLTKKEILRKLSSIKFPEEKILELTNINDEELFLIKLLEGLNGFTLVKNFPKLGISIKSLIEIDCWNHLIIPSITFKKNSNICSFTIYTYTSPYSKIDNFKKIFKSNDLCHTLNETTLQLFNYLSIIFNIQWYSLINFEEGKKIIFDTFSSKEDAINFLENKVKDSKKINKKYKVKSAHIIGPNNLIFDYTREFLNRVNQKNKFLNFIYKKFHK